MIASTRVAKCLFLLAFFLVVGCGGSSSLVPVEGVVTLDGKPLADATIVLHPITAKGPGPFVATTDSLGKFSLKPSNDTAKTGVVSGTYRLAISTLKLAPNNGADDAKPQILAKELVPEEYRMGNMQFKVEPEGITNAVLDLTSAN